MVVISKALMKAALLITASFSLSGCVYDVGLGFASDGYNDDGYGCDPYGGYDSYYDCDYGQGFGDIGFSGGYYDNYFYPGYGFLLFDNVGRKYPMRDHHRRYWGEKRQLHYREFRGRDREGRRYDGRQRSYSDNVTPGVRNGQNQREGRARDGQDERRAARREGRGATSSLVQNPNDVERTGRRRGREVGSSHRDRRGNGASNGYNILQPQSAQQDTRTQTAAPMPRAVPTTRPNPSLPRRGRNEGENVRDQ